MQIANELKLRTLEQMTDNLGSLKAQIDSLTEVYKRDKQDLLDDMKQEGATFLKGRTHSIEIKMRSKASFRDEEIIPYLKENREGIAVKTVEVVDEEALEDAIFNGQITAEEVKPFMSVTETEAVYVKALK
jgi:hypothetical protein